MAPLLAVLRVVNVLPQVHVTVVSTYSGWMPLFTGSLLGLEVAGSCCAEGGAREPEPASVCQTLNQGSGTLIPVLRPMPAEHGNPSRLHDRGAHGGRPPPVRSVVVAARDRRVALHLHEELDVALRLLHAVEEQLDGLLGLERTHDPAQLPDDVELLLRHEDLLTPGPGGVDVDGGEDALVGQLARQPQLHVPGALELLEDDLVLFRPGLDQRGGNDRK